MESEASHSLLSWQHWKRQRRNLPALVHGAVRCTGGGCIRKNACHRFVSVKRCNKSLKLEWKFSAILRKLFLTAFVDISREIFPASKKFVWALGKCLFFCRMRSRCAEHSQVLKSKELIEDLQFSKESVKCASLQTKVWRTNWSERSGSSVG